MVICILDTFLVLPKPIKFIEKNWRKQALNRGLLCYEPILLTTNHRPKLGQLQNVKLIFHLDHYRYNCNFLFRNVLLHRP